MTKNKKVRSPKSTALDAFQAKDAEARQRLADIFVAFVRIPVTRMGKTIGFMVTGCQTDDEAGSYENQNFLMSFVGSPVLQVDEVESMIKTLGFLWESRVSAKDFHSFSARSALCDLNQATIESSQYPRASAVEAIFIDKRAVGAEMQRVSYMGEHLAWPLRKGPARVIIGGCYNPARRAQVESILRELIRGRVTAAKMRSVVTQLQRVAKVRRVTIRSVPADAS